MYRGCQWMVYNRITVNFLVRPSQVNSSFLVILLAENLPSLQQKKNEGLKKKRAR